MNESLDSDSDQSLEYTTEIAVVEKISGSVTPQKIDHDTPVHDSEYTENYVREKFYWLKPASDLGVAAVMLVLEFVAFFLVQTYSSVSLGFVFVITIALTILYAVRTMWIWKNWTYEIDPLNNSITLYMPGYRWLLIREHGAPTIPMLGSSVTDYSQSNIEQWFFRRSYMVTIDNDLQTDEEFHDMRFVKDAEKLRKILVWYNNINQRREKEEGDINRLILQAIQETNNRLGLLIEAFKAWSGIDPGESVENKSI